MNSPQSPNGIFNTLVFLMNIYDVHLIVYAFFFFHVHLRLENSAEMFIILLNGNGNQ